MATLPPKPQGVHSPPRPGLVRATRLLVCAPAALPPRVPLGPEDCRGECGTPYPRVFLWCHRIFKRGLHRTEGPMPWTSISSASRFLGIFLSYYASRSGFLSNRNVHPFDWAASCHDHGSVVSYQNQDWISTFKSPRQCVYQLGSIRASYICAISPLRSASGSLHPQVCLAFLPAHGPYLLTVLAHPSGRVSAHNPRLLSLLLPPSLRAPVAFRGLRPSCLPLLARHLACVDEVMTEPPRHPASSCHASTASTSC